MPMVRKTCEERTEPGDQPEEGSQNWKCSKESVFSPHWAKRLQIDVPFEFFDVPSSWVIFQHHPGELILALNSWLTQCWTWGNLEKETCCNVVGNKTK